VQRFEDLPNTEREREDTSGVGGRGGRAPVPRRAFVVDIGGHLSPG
jgi:hypothetical protein